jgi:hypothetical protein
MKIPRSNQHQLKLFEQRAEQEIQTWQPVRDDFNFCRLALFAAADKHADRFRDIKQQYTVESGGKSFKAVWEVRHDPELGLLGTFDRDVWMGILEYAEELAEGSGRSKRYPDKIELGSSKGFLKRIGKPESGRYVAMFHESIKRLLKTICFSEKAYNVPASGGYMNVMENMSLITAAAFKGEPDGNEGVHETTWVRLGEFVRKNLESGYIALIDVKYVRQLKGELSKHLVPFLSYRLWLAVQHGRDYQQVHWEELRQYLAASGWDSLSRAKKRLKAAFEELKSREYIDETSEWNGPHYVFKVGKKFIDELATRLNTREQYDAWITGRKSAMQLRLLPLQQQQPLSKPTSEEEREAALTRQAIRVALLNQHPDPMILQRHGWTLDDVHSLANNMRQKNNLDQLR